MLIVCFHVINVYQKGIILLIKTIDLGLSAFVLGAKNAFAKVPGSGNFTRLDKVATKTIKNDKLAEFYNLRAGNR